MNRNYRKALKYRMPTDAEMEAMGCRYLTDEELEKLLGGRPDDGDINDVAGPNASSDWGGSSSSSDWGGGNYGESSSNSGSGYSGSSSSDASASSNSSESSGTGNSTSHEISAGETLSGIAHEHFPDLQGQDFVDKVHEIAEANGIENIDHIEAGATISIPGSGSSTSGQSAANGHSSNSSEYSGANSAGDYASAIGTSNGSGKTGATSGTGTVATEETPATATTSTANAKDEKSSKGGFWGGLAAFGNGVKAFFDDPIAAVGRATAFVGGAAKNAWDGAKNAAGNAKDFVVDGLSGLFGGGKNAATSIPNNVTTAKNSESKNTKTMSFPVDQSISRVTSEFGHREEISTSNGKTKAGHGGIDFAAPQGTPVTSAMDGWVKDKGYVENGYGNYVVIGEKSDSWVGDLTYYAHLENPSSVGVGEYVSQGQQIGTVGNTGKSTGPHLHFETRTDWGGTKHDPRDYLPFP